MSTGRFQSQVFRFLSQKVLRLRDQSSQTWRHIRVAAIWGLQVALYPLYALFQTTRVVGKQMGQAARQAVPRLRAVGRALQPTASPLPATDQPIVRSLTTARTFIAAAAIAPSPATSKALVPEPSEIRGIATLLTNRTLVLVTAQNDILDILTPEQQVRLFHFMIGELANYWRQQKQFSSSPTIAKLGPAPTPFFLPLPSDRPHLFPPIRAFRRLMAWMQLSPVAIATNLFQESRLVESIAPSEPILIQSDQLPWSSLEAFWVDLLGVPSATFRANLVHWLETGQTTAEHLVERLTEPLFRDSAPRAELPSQSLPPLRSAEANPSPWFSPNDLSPSRPMRTETTRPADSPARAIAAEIAVPPVRQPATAAEVTIVASSVASSSPPTRPESATKPKTLEIVPTYIETEVKLVGYVKHPLEQVLEWLDSGMLWIEKNIARMWHWLRNCFHG